MRKSNELLWQLSCDIKIKDEENVIISSPTGSGKTARYENWALLKKERPIFITSPIKSLSNQKYRNLKLRGYKVGIETGDIKVIPDDCDIICCTQEVYNNKYRSVYNSTLIIDEFSYIFENGERARAYIDSLYYSQAKNILLCSATFKNSDEIAKYISTITNREFFVFENKKRITSLEYKDYIDINNIEDSFVVTFSYSECKNIAKKICDNRIKNQRLKYTKNKEAMKNEIEKIAKKYKINNDELLYLVSYKIAYYYGGLYPKEKLFIEELFEKRLIDTVVGTDALALGVNFPIKNVIFTRTSRTMNGRQEKISKNSFDQISGRAGRKGYFDEGYVYYNDNLVDMRRENLKKNYEDLVNGENEKYQIDLKYDIKGILLGKVSCYEEANFVCKYSTNQKDFYTVYNEMCEIEKYIKNIDIASYYIKHHYQGINFENGYEDAISKYSNKFKEKLEKLTSSLMHLQRIFIKDIGRVYMDEYTVDQNCIIFIDILANTSLEKMIEQYGKNFYDLMLLRKYLYSLPEEYRKNYNLNKLDSIINKTDQTVLNPDMFEEESEILIKK